MKYIKKRRNTWNISTIERRGEADRRTDGRERKRCMQVKYNKVKSTQKFEYLRESIRPNGLDEEAGKERASS